MDSSAPPCSKCTKEAIERCVECDAAFCLGCSEASHAAPELRAHSRIAYSKSHVRGHSASAALSAEKRELPGAHAAHKRAETAGVFSEPPLPPSQPLVGPARNSRSTESEISSIASLKSDSEEETADSFADAQGRAKRRRSSKSARGGPSLGTEARKSASTEDEEEGTAFSRQVAQRGEKILPSDAVQEEKGEKVEKGGAKAPEDDHNGMSNSLADESTAAQGSPPPPPPPPPPPSPPPPPLPQQRQQEEKKPQERTATTEKNAHGALSAASTPRAEQLELGLKQPEKTDDSTGTAASQPMMAVFEAKRSDVDGAGTTLSLKFERSVGFRAPTPALLRALSSATRETAGSSSLARALEEDDDVVQPALERSSSHLSRASNGSSNGVGSAGAFTPGDRRNEREDKVLGPEFLSIRSATSDQEARKVRSHSFAAPQPPSTPRATSVTARLRQGHAREATLNVKSFRNFRELESTQAMMDRAVSEAKKEMEILISSSRPQVQAQQAQTQVPASQSIAQGPSPTQGQGSQIQNQAAQPSKLLPESEVMSLPVESTALPAASAPPVEPQSEPQRRKSTTSASEALAREEQQAPAPRKLSVTSTSSARRNSEARAEVRPDFLTAPSQSLERRPSAPPAPLFALIGAASTIVPAAAAAASASAPVLAPAAAAAAAAATLSAASALESPGGLEIEQSVREQAALKVSRSDDKAERQGNAAPSQQDGQPSESEPPKDVPRMLRALSRRRAGSIIDSEEVRKLVEVASAEVAARQKSGPDSSTQLPPATEDSAATGSTAARPIASEQGQAPDLASANNKQASATDARSIGDLSGHSRRSSRALSDATRRSEGSLPARKETTTAKTKTKKDQRVDRRKREVADHVKQLRDEVKSAFLKRKQDRGDVLVGAFPSAAESTVRTHRGRLRVTGGSDSQEERQEKGVMASVFRSRLHFHKSGCLQRVPVDEPAAEDGPAAELAESAAPLFSAALLSARPQGATAPRDQPSRQLPALRLPRCIVFARVDPIGALTAELERALERRAELQLLPRSGR